MPAPRDIPDVNYPSRCTRTVSLAEAACGSVPCGFACGRVIRVTAGEIVLEDESGSAGFALGAGAAVNVGDIVELSFDARIPGSSSRKRAGVAGEVRSLRLLARARKPPEANSDYARFTPELREVLRMRARLVGAIRRYFTEAGFLEVETPSLVASPGLEPHLRAFATEYVSEGAAGSEHAAPAMLFLPTSPEYHMKRMLAAGFERIFQLCRCWRNGESFELHNPEFTMLEWYRAYADAEAIMADLEGLGAALAIEAGPGRSVGPDRSVGSGRGICFRPPWPRITVREAFRTLAGIILPAEDDADAFRRAARAAGVTGIGESDGWHDVFCKAFLALIEPKLGVDRPAFLTEYPASMAALAKRKVSDPAVAERFELYIGGVEIANGFTELNDPAEQRRRFEEEAEERRSQGAPAHPIDERLLDALEIGMPPAGGVAVGVDRLLMILAGRRRIEDVIAFPFSQDFPPEKP